MTTQSILNVASRFVERVDVGSEPIDTSLVARAIGLSVAREELDEDVWGAIVKTPKGLAAILNTRHPANRQRAVLAHIIGHLELGHRFPSLVHVERRLDAYREERRYSPVERIEFEANVFAASLLIPTRLLRKALAKHPREPLSDEDIQQLATQFGVSVQGMTLRLTRAGLL